MRIANLEVDLPTSWEDHSLYTYVAPPEDVSPSLSVKKTHFRKNVVFQQRHLDGDETLADCVALAVKNTTQMFGNIKVEVTDGPAGAAGIDAAKRLVYTVIDDVTGQPVAQVIYLCLLERVEWQVAFSVAAIALEAALPEFDRVVGSLRPA